MAMTLRLSPQQDAELKLAADSRGLSKQQLLSQLVDQFTSNRTPLTEIPRATSSQSILEILAEDRRDDALLS